MCQLSSLKAIGKVAQASSLLDNNNFEAAKNALSGLSTEAAVSASSFLKFTEAQTAALLKSTGFSAEMVATELATQGAGKAVTAAALAEAGFSKEAISAALATATFQTAEESTIIATNTFGASLKNLGKGLKAFLTSTPLGWITIAAATIYGAVKIFNKINEAQDRAIERANQAQQEYENVQSEIASLESQLESINSQIAEINSSGPLSFTDREQLELLEAQRKELEQQIELKQKIAEYKGAEAANEAEKALTTRKSEKEKVGVNSQSNMAENVGGWTSLDPIDKAENLYDRIQEVTERRNRKIEDTTKRWDTMSDSERKWAQKIIAGYDKDISWLQTELGDKLETIDEQRSKLVDDTGKALSGHENTIARIDALYDKVITKADEAGQAVASSSEPPIAMSKNTREKYNQISAANDRTKTGQERAPAIAAARKEYEDALAADLEATSFTVDIEAEAKGFDAVQSALKASADAAGLSSEAVATLTARYQNLDSFNPEALFQRTANGVRLDTDEVAKLESELQGATQTGFDNQLRVWTEQLDEVNGKLENSNNLSADEIAKLIASRGELVQKITGAKELATQYAALTSNYQQWLDAQSAGEEGDMYDNIVKGYDKAKELFDKGLTGTNEFREYVELVSGKDLSAEPVKAVVDEWERLNKVSSSTGFAPLDYLSDGSAGVENFISAVQKVESEWVSFNEKTKTWSINVESVDELAEKLGVDSELVEALLKKAGDYGVTVSTQVQDSFGNAITSIEDAMSTLQSQLESRGIKIDLETTDIETATTQMGDFYDYYKTLLDENGKIKLDTSEAQAAYTVMSSLWDLWTQLSTKDSVVYNIDSSSITEASSAADKFVGALDGVIEAKQELAKRQALGLDTSEAEKNLQDAITNLNTLYGKLDDDEKGKLKLKLDKGEITKENIDSIISQLDAKPECLVDLKVSKGILPADMTPEGDTKEVNLKIGTNAVQQWIDEKGKETDVSIKPLLTAYNTWLGKIDTKNVKVIETRIRKGDGPVPVNEFQGTAHAGGKWGAPRDEVALTGELGEELWVSPSTGRWQTVGANGAEFAHIPKGAIVFNHKQTEQLLKYGHINSRGRALASGTAYVNPNKPNVKFTGFTSLNDSARGTTVIGNKPLQAVAKAAETASKTVTDTARTVATNTKTATTASEEAADTVKDEASGLTDWVSKVLENIDKKTEKYLAKADKKAEAGNYSGAARQYQKALNTYDKSIGKHGDAENLYMRQANGALSKAIADGTISKETAATIQKRVANGAMDISKLSDGTKAVVDAYKEYYDKAVAAQEATQELYDKYEETAKKMYQLPLDQASAKTDKLKNSYDLLEKKLEVVHNKTTQVKLIEQEMANVRQQHAAQMKSYTQAHQNYLAAERKINESSDKALKGLSDNVVQAINEMVKAGETIDYTELTGLTDTAKLAIIDYNAALEAQSQALYDSTASMLDTITTLRELSEAKYGKPNEQAEEEISKRDEKRGVRDAQYNVAGTAKEKNAILTKNDTSARNDQTSRQNAKDKTKSDLQSAWNNLAVDYPLETTSIGEEIKYGQKVSAAQFKRAAKELGYKKDSDEYNALLNAVIEYNDAIDADKKAARELTKQKAETTAALQENAAKRVQNVVDEEQSKIDAKQTQIDNATAGMEQLGNVINAINAASTQEEKDRLANLFKDAYGWEIDPNKTYAENQATGYDYLKTLNSDLVGLYGTAKKTVDAQINAEKDLTADQRTEFQNISNGFADAGVKASNAIIEAGQKFAAAVNEGSPEKQGERDAQGRLDTANQNIASKQAAGQVLTTEDHKAIVDAINGYTDEDGNEIQGLLSYKKADLADLKEQAKTLIEGTDAWKENQDAQKALQDEIDGLTRSAKDAADAIRQLGLDENTKKLDEIGHNQAMLDAKTRQANAMGQAIGGALGIDGGNIGNAISTVFELIGGGAAIGKGVVDAFNNPDGFSLSGLFESVGASVSEYNRTSTQAGIREDERKTLEERLQYLKDNPVAEGDEGYDAYIKEYRETEEKLANNAADAAEDVANAAQSAGNAMSDAVNEAKKFIADMMHRRTNMIKLKLADIEAELKRISSDMAMTEARGLETNYDQLIEQIKLTNKEIEVYEKELIPQLKREEAFTESDDDRSASEKLQDHQAVLDAEAQLEDLKLESFKLQRIALRDKILDPLTKAHEEVERMRDVLVGIDDLITDDMLFDAEGQISRNGQARLDMLIGQYRAAEAEVQNFKDDIDALNNFRNNGLFSNIELDKMIAESQGKLLDAEKDRVEIALKYIDIVKQAGEEELESLNEIIDARQDALQAKKDYYDYDKTIRGKTKDIQALQAQIAALEGLTDAESKAKRARLEADLAEAQEDLDDTIQQHMFEISSDSLDKLRDTLEEAHEDEWKEITGDLEKLLAYVDNINSSVGNDQIDANVKEVLREIGIQFKEIEGQEVDATQFATIFQSAFDKVMDKRYDDATKQQVFDALRQIYPQMVAAGSWYGSYKEYDTPEEEALAAAGKTDNNTPMDKPPEVKLSFWERLLKWLQDIFNAIKDALDKIGNWFSNAFGNIGNWFKNTFKLPGFASGTRGVSKTGPAWTHKDEWIVRKSDGGILTPLSKGDGVLPADLTQRLYQLAQGNMPQMQMPKMQLPDYNIVENYSPNITIDSSIHVEGSVDAAVISDLKKFRDDMCEDAYRYTSEKMYRGYMHSGGKRRI